MAGLSLLLLLIVFPLRSTLVRLSIILLTFCVWAGLLSLVWRKLSLRSVMLTVLFLSAVLISLPSRARIHEDQLREIYAAKLRNYDGTHYFYGGENSRGIDCSGLVRARM